MNWVQIHQGLKWDDPIVKQYVVTGIPATFLIDQEGRLVKITGGLENSIRRVLNGTEESFGCSVRCCQLVLNTQP